MRFGSLLLVALLGAVMAVPATAAAEIDPSEDVFNQQTFNALDGSGREVPFTTAQNLSRQFNSAGFTFDPSFETLERMRSGCGSTNAVRASRTAYMRFLPGVRGTFSITASTAYDVVLFGYRTAQPRHDRRFAEGELDHDHVQRRRRGHRQRAQHGDPVLGGHPEPGDPDRQRQLLRRR